MTWEQQIGLWESNVTDETPYHFIAKQNRKDMITTHHETFLRFLILTYLRFPCCHKSAKRSSFFGIPHQASLCKAVAIIMHQVVRLHSFLDEWPMDIFIGGSGGCSVCDSTATRRDATSPYIPLRMRRRNDELSCRSRICGPSCERPLE
jgi:hypothetical protein